MERSVEVLIGITVLLFMVIFTAVVYRWRQRQRARHIAKEIKTFLLSRYEKLPDHLNINCSDDRLWPVIVTFDKPGTASRLLLQFSFPGHMSRLYLLSEVEQLRLNS